MTEQPENKMSFETWIQMCMVNFGLSPCPKWQLFYYPTDNPTPSSLCCTSFKSEGIAPCFTRSRVVWSYLCWLTGTWNFPILSSKTFEHKALFFVSLLIFLETLPTYQILQWSHNHCASVKSLPTVIKTHHYNPILGSSWWRNSVEYILFKDTSSLAAEVTAQIQFEHSQAQSLIMLPTHFNYLPFP